MLTRDRLRLHAGALEAVFLVEVDRRSHCWGRRRPGLGLVPLGLRRLLGGRWLLKGNPR